MKLVRGALPFLFTALTACGGVAGPPSILLVTLDTTRADRIGCYGRAGAGTPTLDALARRGARFERVYTPVPITLPAHTALLTGTTPAYNGVRDNGHFRVDPRLETLAEVLAGRGYRTGAAVASYPLFPEYGLDQGFDFYDAEFRVDQRGDFLVAEERPADEVVDVAAAWLGSVLPGDPFLLWVHLFDPHWPYAPPEPFASEHAADPYQGEIAFADAQIGRLLDELERQGRTADTVVAVTADHGEAHGEHGERTHAFLVHDATVRVPLILAGPGVARGAEIDVQASVIDVLPTLCDILDAPAPPGVQGRSLAPLLRGETLPPRSDYLESHYASLHYGWSTLDAVVSDSWKLVSAPQTGAQRDQLFDLRSDPGELVDRAAAEPARLAELRAELEGLRRTLVAPTPFDAGHTLSPDDVAALAAIGYSDSADAEADEAGIDPREHMGVAEAFILGKSHVQRGELQEARALLAEIEREEPDGFSARFLLALIVTAEARSRPSRVAEALGAFDRALELRPTRAPVWRNKARAQRMAGDHAGALRSLRTAVSLAPAQPLLKGELEEAEARVRREIGVLDAAGDAGAAATLRAALEDA